MHGLKIYEKQEAELYILITSNIEIMTIKPKVSQHLHIHVFSNYSCIFIQVLSNN